MGSCAIFPIIKGVLLLVVSFFVLIGVTKVGSQRIKKFGRILAIVLWILSACMMICSVYLSACGKSSSQKYLKYHKYNSMMKCR